MLASLAPSPLIDVFVPRKPHERRVSVALVCSGVFHALLALASTSYFALRPSAEEPPSTDRPAIVAVLQDLRPTPEITAIAPVTESEPDKTPQPMATITASAPAPAPAAVAPPRAVPAPVRGPITSSDPNGNVTAGMLEEPAVLGHGIAGTLGDRYPGRVDKIPRMITTPIIPYPAAAREAHASARISAVLDVDERGRITRMALYPDHPWFGPAVNEALKEARFAPAELATNPVPYWAIVEFVFAIAPAAPASTASTAPELSDRHAGSGELPTVN